LLSLVSVLLFSVTHRLLAASYVVPTDRFEIERSSAIVIGHVLASHVENSPQFGIETVTDVVLEEAIKGSAGVVIQIHEPGGILGDEARVIPDVPQFMTGERVLLFLYQRENGDYTINDLQLGAFHFEKDVLTRELNGWDVDGTVHKEPRRSAERFINYIRGVVRNETVAVDYIVSTETQTPSHPITDAVFTATSYTIDFSGGLGARWNVFPSAVNWNQGSSQTGALGNGTSQINVAFSSWNGGGAHYVLTSAVANQNGIMDASDHVNNIVFEKNLTASGVQPYSCTQGGVLGLGGIHSAFFGGGAHVFHGETFGTAMEGDVSMNQGLGACTLAQFPTSEFNSTVTHEFGHTLGFRHSDQNRTLNAVCSSDPSLDCSNSAIMNHIIVFGLNGNLQSWDVSAVTAVYGNACTPPSISQQPSGSTITAGNAAQLSVIAAGTPTFSYQWYIGASGNVASPVIGGTTATISVSPAATTSYWVRVIGQCAPSIDSSTATVTVNPLVCPAVILGTPQANQVNGGYALTLGASGGSSFTFQWFQGPAVGAGSPLGVGNPLLVNPSQTASYWCRVTNGCNNKADSTIVTVTVVPCSAPQVISQPPDQQAFIGATVPLTVGFTGSSATVSWFEGAKGDTSTPVGSGQTITSPALAQTTQFWARIANPCGSADSSAATVTVTSKSARRHSAGH
jgi:hypothetical protein